MTPESFRTCGISKDKALWISDSDSGAFQPQSGKIWASKYNSPQALQQKHTCPTQVLVTLKSMACKAHGQFQVLAKFTATPGAALGTTFGVFFRILNPNFTSVLGFFDSYSVSPLTQRPQESCSLWTGSVLHWCREKIISSNAFFS